MDVSVHKRRLGVMLSISALSLLAAGGAIFGYVARDIAILGPVFVAAIAAGVAAQVWFIVGVAKTPSGKV
jgi:hypothetical protein